MCAPGSHELLTTALYEHSKTCVCMCICIGGVFVFILKTLRMVVLFSM